MFKALVKKKLREFQANHVYWHFLILFAISLLFLLRVWFDTPLATALSLAGLFGMCLFLGMICATMAFNGDFANQADQFLAYLPLRRSTFWLANYLCGLAVLCLSAIALFSLDVLFFPLGSGTAEAWHDTRPYQQFVYLLPSGMAVAVSCASILFLMYSLAVFPVAYFGAKDARTNNANGLGVLAVMGTLFAPVAVVTFLAQFSIVPSGLALSPILLTSGVLYSAGGYALFARVPRHISAAKHALLGLGLFLAISAVLFGQLYVKYHAWRVLDPSQVAQVIGGYLPHLDGEQNLILADVDSFRSGKHCVSIDVEQGTYHDLGRGLNYVDVHGNNSGRLHFVYDPSSVFPSYTRRQGYFTSMSPDASDIRSFKIPCDEFGGHDEVRWLLDRGLVVYSAHTNGQSHRDLCVADSSGKLLRRFDLRGSRDFLVDPAGRVLAIAPTVTTSSDVSGTTTPEQEKPYMMIDLDSGSVQRFGLPGRVVYFAKDLGRVICSRTRIENGRQYQSYVLVELPSLDERVILAEDEFPPQEVTASVDTTIHPSIAIDDGTPTPLLRVNDAFDTLLWRKQRADGDDFRYSIVMIDLNTSQQQVAVPESDTPKVPVVIAKGAQQEMVYIHRFIADDAAFSYEIGSRIYLYDMTDRQSVLLADKSIPFDESQEEGRFPYVSDYAPSGRRVCRTGNVWHEVTEDRPMPRLKLSAVEIFENGKPVRLYTGQRPIHGAQWLDEERIVFYEEAAIFVLDSAGGPRRQVFPP